MNTSKITVHISARALGCVLIIFVIIFFQNKYKEKFNKERGKPYASTIDTPEIRRIKKVQEQLSEVDIKCCSFCSSSLSFNNKSHNLGNCNPKHLNSL